MCWFGCSTQQLLGNPISLTGFGEGTKGSMWWRWYSFNEYCCLREYSSCTGIIAVAESKWNAQILQNFAVFVLKAVSHVVRGPIKFIATADLLMTTGTGFTVAESASEHEMDNGTAGAATVGIEAMDADEMSGAKAHQLVVCFPKSVRSLLDQWCSLGSFIGVPLDEGIGQCE
jgi:hypothetical protein